MGAVIPIIKKSSEIPVTDRPWKQPGTLEFAKRQAILEALQASNYAMVGAAKRLRISRSTIYRMRDIYEINEVEDS
ncbi:MAG: hypothetical protein EOO77_05395 [Oxalobacteraceae bacterium]|nr:MAG: hypothetical protein EOO77_05395 [Oxalobacteraceae bacterium]